uniref:FAR1 domain-containing protein n=1 Tax=Globisporangium ultimum (strain ATCC 200006 / CBS 805.95 / DAOM BR144) TaxID=431595 RepID=K3WTW8_GLOUD
MSGDDLVEAVPATDAALLAAATDAPGSESKKRRARSASSSSGSTPSAASLGVAPGVADGDNVLSASTDSISVLDVPPGSDGVAVNPTAAVIGAAANASSTNTEDEEPDNTEFTEDENDAMQDVMAKMKEATDASTTQFNSQPEKRMQLFESKRMNRVSFNSWFEFDSYFEMYMQDTFQPFRMRSSCSVEAYRRNQQKVMMTNKNSRGRRIEFPDSAIHHHRIYMCTHAMKARCRGATTRPGQKYRGIGCIAKINVKISPSDNPNHYMVIVTDQVVSHNHPISREIYEAYPDVLLKTMRRNQLAPTLPRQLAPKFESPSQTQKFERTLNLLTPLAEAMARLTDEEYEAQFAELQKVYAQTITEHNTV